MSASVVSHSATGGAAAATANLQTIVITVTSSTKENEADTISPLRAPQLPTQTPPPSPGPGGKHSKKASKRGRGLRMKLKIFKNKRKKPDSQEDGLFGQTLRSICSEEDKLPPELMQLLKILFLHGPSTEGIFRKNANSKNQQLLKSQADYWVKLGSSDVLLVGCLLKDFLRTLPDCLLTCVLYDQWLDSCRAQPDQHEKISTLQSLVDRLPPENHLLLRHLICLLHEIQKSSSINKMTSENLAICFGPTLLWSKTATLDGQRKDVDRAVATVQALIDNASSVFGDETLNLLKELSEMPNSQISKETLMVSEMTKTVLSDQTSGHDIVGQRSLLRIPKVNSASCISSPESELPVPPPRRKRSSAVIAPKGDELSIPSLQQNLTSITNRIQIDRNPRLGWMMSSKKQSFESDMDDTESGSRHHCYETTDYETNDDSGSVEESSLTEEELLAVGCGAAGECHPDGKFSQVNTKRISLASSSNQSPDTIRTGTLTIPERHDLNDIDYLPDGKVKISSKGKKSIGSTDSGVDQRSSGSPRYEKLNIADFLGEPESDAKKPFGGSSLTMAVKSPPRNRVSVSGAIFEVRGRNFDAENASSNNMTTDNTSRVCYEKSSRGGDQLRTAVELKKECANVNMSPCSTRRKTPAHLYADSNNAIGIRIERSAHQAPDSDSSEAIVRNHHQEQMATTDVANSVLRRYSVGSKATDKLTINQIRSERQGMTGRGNDVFPPPLSTILRGQIPPDGTDTTDSTSRLSSESGSDVIAPPKVVKRRPPKSPAPCMITKNFQFQATINTDVMPEHAVEIVVETERSNPQLNETKMWESDTSEVHQSTSDGFTSSPTEVTSARRRRMEPPSYEEAIKQKNLQKRHSTPQSPSNILELITSDAEPGKADSRINRGHFEDTGLVNNTDTDIKDQMPLNVAQRKFGNAFRKNNFDAVSQQRTREIAISDCAINISVDRMTYALQNDHPNTILPRHGCPPSFSTSSLEAQSSSVINQPSTKWPSSIRSSSSIHLQLSSSSDDDLSRHSREDERKKGGKRKRNRRSRGNRNSDTRLSVEHKNRVNIVRSKSDSNAMLLLKTGSNQFFPRRHRRESHNVDEICKTEIWTKKDDATPMPKPRKEEKENFDNLSRNERHGGKVIVRDREWHKELVAGIFLSKQAEDHHISDNRSKNKGRSSQKYQDLEITQQINNNKKSLHKSRDSFGKNDKKNMISSREANNENSKIPRSLVHEAAIKIETNPNDNRVREKEKLLHLTRDSSKTNLTKSSITRSCVNISRNAFLADSNGPSWKTGSASKSDETPAKVIRRSNSSSSVKPSVVTKTSERIATKEKNETLDKSKSRRKSEKLEAPDPQTFEYLKPSTIEVRKAIFEEKGNKNSDVSRSATTRKDDIDMSLKCKTASVKNNVSCNQEKSRKSLLNTPSFEEEKKRSIGTKSVNRSSSFIARTPSKQPDLVREKSMTLGAGNRRSNPLSQGTAGIDPFGEERTLRSSHLETAGKKADLSTSGKTHPSVERARSSATGSSSGKRWMASSDKAPVGNVPSVEQTKSQAERLEYREDFAAKYSNTSSSSALHLQSQDSSHHDRKSLLRPPSKATTSTRDVNVTSVSRDVNQPGGKFAEAEKMQQRKIKKDPFRPSVALDVKPLPYNSADVNDSCSDSGAENRSPGNGMPWSVTNLRNFYADQKRH